MTLSVLSALARLDLDPWEETAALASMPRDKAKERLAALFKVSTKDLAPASSSHIVAARLIALLPTTSTLKIPTPGSAAKAKSSSVAVLLGIVLLISMSLTVYFGGLPLPLFKFGHPDRTTNSAFSQ